MGRLPILREEWDELRERPLRGLRYVAALIALALFLWFLSHVTTGWFVGFATRAGIFAILAIGLNVQWGYTGVFNFGVVSFFMVGAYVSAILTLGAPDDFEGYVAGWDMPVIVGWLAGMLAGGALALLVGMPTLRLRRDFLAIATIGIAAILRSVANSVEGLVNRAQGLRGIDPLLGDSRWEQLAIVLVVLLIVYVLVSRITESPWGRVQRAIRENEDTARAAGKNTVNFRIQSFVVGGMIMGLAGGVFGSWFSAIAPTTFSDLFGTFLVWAMLIVGGSGNNKGAVVGAVVVMLFWFGLPLVQTDLPDFLGTRVFEIRQMSIGLLIVLFLIFRPQGLLPERRRVSRFAPRGPVGVSPLERLRARLRQPPAPPERG